MCPNPDQWDLRPNLIRTLVEDFPSWWKRKTNREYIFPHFSCFTYFCVWGYDVGGVAAIFTPWGQVQEHHREDDTESCYCWATEWTPEPLEFFFMWEKQTFISQHFSFWLFCLLKLKVSSLIQLYNSYTFLLECKPHEDRDQVYFTPNYSDFNPMEVYFSLTQSLTCCDGCVMLSRGFLLCCCSAIPKVLPSSIKLKMAPRDVYIPARRREKGKRRGCPVLLKALAGNCSVTWLIILFVRT